MLSKGRLSATAKRELEKVKVKQKRMKVKERM